MASCRCSDGQSPLGGRSQRTQSHRPRQSRGKAQLAGRGRRWDRWRVIVAGANVHETKLLASQLPAVVVERPESTEEEPQHLCLEKGYDNPTGRETVAAYCYVPHI